MPALANKKPKHPTDRPALLLGWYDRHRRKLPWRPPAGEWADPYRVWLSEIMLQQTGVKTVGPYFQKFVERWPDVEALGRASLDDVLRMWAGLGYYSRARNLHACAVAVRRDHDGVFPDTEHGLRALPGIGPYTAAAIAAIAFGAPATVVDANVERVVARLFRLADKGDVRAAAAQLTPRERAGDFAQAMMDLGATICTSRSPKCLLCPIRETCAAFAASDQDAWPVKPRKAPKPQRFGTIFWAQAGDDVLLVRRPPRGLLGGMRALPTGPWVDSPPGLADPPLAAGWTTLEATVLHGFTHFDLQLALAAARVERHAAPDAAIWWPIESLGEAGLPTIFAKAARKIGGF